MEAAETKLEPNRITAFHRKEFPDLLERNRLRTMFSLSVGVSGGAE